MSCFSKGVNEVLLEHTSLYEEIDYPYSVGFKCFTASIDSSCPHWHDAYEMIIPLKGEVRVRYNGELFTLRKGHVILVNSREIHSIMAGFQCNVCLFLQFSPNIFKMVSDKGARTFNFYLNTADPSIKQLASPLKFIKSVTDIWLLGYERNKGYQFQMHSELFQLVADLIAYTIYDERFLGDVNNADSDTFILDKLSNFVKENYKEDISTEDICKRLAMSRSTLYRFSKSVLGCSINDYLHYHRIKEAKKLLRETDHSISYISDICGYSNDTSFYRAFKHYVEKTPSEFRKEGAAMASDGRIQGYITHDLGAVYRLIKDSPVLRDLGTRSGNYWAR